MKLYIKLFLTAAMSVFLANCSAIDKQIKHGKLDVQTKMSATVFLDPVAECDRTVLLQIRNTSDKKDLDVATEIRSAIQARGYRVVTDPAKAHYMIQANVLQVGKTTDNDPFGSLASGYGGAVAGALVGGGLSGHRDGAVGGMIVGGLVGTIADAAVQVVHYRMITDLQLSEKADDAIVRESSTAHFKQGTSGHKKSTWKQKTQWKRYQTRIISVATKTNLKFEKALPELKQGLIQSISGLL